MKQPITLEELIPNPKSLRLLILHTPFPLNFEPLQLCTNLIKLDISNNNLESVPYLGSLNHLRFLFLHNNRMDFEQLKRVFSMDPSNPYLARSALSNGVVWVTFWGNKSCFYSRHYLVTNTNAIAVDRNLVVEEEKTEGIQSHYIQPYSQQTELEFPLLKLQNKPTGYTEEQYLQHFYKQLSILRKKHCRVNFVLTIQRFFRGWQVRASLRRQKEERQSYLKKMRSFAMKWVNFVQNKVTLRRICEKRGKSYLCGDLKDYKRHMIDQKMIKLAREAKRRVAIRNQRQKFYRKIKQALLKNYYSFQVLYEEMQIQTFKKLYISVADRKIFQQVILPLARQKHPNITLSKQNRVRVLRMPFAARCQIPYVSILYPGSKGVFTIYGNKTTKRKKLQINIKPVDKRCPLSNKDRKKSNDLYNKLTKLQNEERQCLLVIESDLEGIKSVCRATILYNQMKLKQYTRRVMLIPEKQVVQSNAVLTLQKLWRGYLSRRHEQPNFIQDLTRRRAATRIQRWWRKLPTIHRKNFMIKVQQMFKKLIDKKIMISEDDYLKLDEKVRRYRLKFLQQHIRVLYQPKNKKIKLTWDVDSHAGIFRPVIIQNQLQNKPLFSKNYLKNVNVQMQNSEQPAVLGDVFHLLHCDTKTRRVSFKNNRQLMIEFKSMAEMRLRLLAFLLLTYDFHNPHDSIIVNPATYDTRSSNEWKCQNIDNPNSIFVFCQSSQYFSKMVRELELPVLSQNLLIYVKENNKSLFPVKVKDCVNVVYSDSLDLTKKEIVREISTCQPTSQEQRKTIFRQSIIQFREEAIKEMEKVYYASVRPSLNDIQKQQKTRYRTVRSNDKLIIRKKQKPQTQADKHRPVFGQDLRTHYRTEQSFEGIPSSLGIPRHQRFLTQISEKPPQTSNTTLRQQRSMSRQAVNTFTNNFVNLSNFVSKQTQINFIRNRRKKIFTETCEITIANRERTERLKEKSQVHKAQKQKRLKEKQIEYEEQLEQEKKKRAEQRQSVPKREKKQDIAKTKIHVVFPEECFPLEPG